MLWRLAADLVAVFHFAFVLAVVCGGFIVWRWPWFRFVHLPVAVWGALIEFTGWICPLTPLENWLRRRAGQEGYPGGFLDHYIFSILYPRGLTRGMQIAIGLFVIAINVFAYWRFRQTQ